ncbi:MAG TPA: hypothetical protein VFB21_06250 [Chthonomonadaceae bacterium]|nr:hypothetical protein [Chthonomonadaceae bacterium]
MPGSIKETKAREEVMNVILADCINDSGLSAEAENVEADLHGSRALPDVVVSFQGLRCSIEGKWEDASRARQIVAEQAKARIKNGIAHLALAVTYPITLRSVPHIRKKQELSTARLHYRLFTEQSAGDWREGDLAAIQDDLRRAQHVLATDDIVTKAVEELQYGMSGLVNVLAGNPTACDRLADIVCVYEPEDKDDEDEE